MYECDLVGHKFVKSNYSPDEEICVYCHMVRNAEKNTHYYRDAIKRLLRVFVLALFAAILMYARVIELLLRRPCRCGIRLNPIERDWNTPEEDRAWGYLGRVRCDGGESVIEQMADREQDA